MYDEFLLYSIVILRGVIRRAPFHVTFDVPQNLSIFKSKFKTFLFRQATARSIVKVHLNICLEFYKLK